LTFIKQIFRFFGLLGAAILVSMWSSVVYSQGANVTEVALKTNLPTSAAHVLPNARLNLQRLKASKEFQKLLSIEQASFALYRSNWAPLYVNNQNLPLIPASTTKILTAYLALQHWGSDHHFYTDFVIEVLPSKAQEPAGKRVNSRQANLWIKGYGDPFLTSEEIALMAKHLHQQLERLGVNQIVSVNLDSRFYDAEIDIPGASKSDNPYDAIPTAIAANFNTAFLEWNGTSWQSAEPQTPITQVAIDAANKRFLPAGKKAKSHIPLKKGFKTRINLGFNPKNNEKHFVQLLLALLNKELARDQSPYPVKLNSVEVNWQALEPSWVSNLQSISQSKSITRWRYRNSKNLQQVLVPMLKYSTNFIANQLALNLAAEHYSLPAGERLVTRYYQDAIGNWLVGANFEEGAGLSRQNQITAEKLSFLLKAFFPYRELLPRVSKGVYAKSGTLHGVTTLAGFIDKNGRSFPFVLMVNEPVAYKFRNRFIQAVRDALEI